jgi:DNA-binding CsgD family transcriptional regulator
VQLIDAHWALAGSAAGSAAAGATSSTDAARVAPSPMPLRAPTVDRGLAELWADLISGRVEIRSELRHGTQLTLFVRDREDPGPEVPSRESHVLARVLSGEQQKAIAMDLGVSPTMVSTLLTSGLAKLGLARDRVPLVVTAAAYAHTFAPPFGAIHCAVVPFSGSLFRRIDIPAPTLAAATDLTPAQRAVACMLIEGYSRGEIATIRGTSRRTVSVQLGSLFSITATRGRYDLIRKVLAENLW